MIGVADIVAIERVAYPAHMREMSDCRSMSDIAEYAECSKRQLRILGMAGHWYAILAKHCGGSAECVDLAKVPGSPTVPWLDIVATLRAMGVTTITLDAREGTSYELICAYAAKLGIRIVSDSVWDWNGEMMHEMRIRL